MSRKKAVPTLGIILILLGGLMILHHYHPFQLHWSVFIIALGAIFFLGGFFQRDKGVILPGTFLFLFGLFFYLRGQDVFYLPWWHIWQLFPLFLGIAFVTLCAFDPARKNALIPGIALICISFFLIFFPWSCFDVLYWMGKLWPIILIIIGVRLVWSATHKKKPPELKT